MCGFMGMLVGLLIIIVSLIWCLCVCLWFIRICGFFGLFFLVFVWLRLVNSLGLIMESVFGILKVSFLVVVVVFLSVGIWVWFWFSVRLVWFRRFRRMVCLILVLWLLLICYEMLLVSGVFGSWGLLCCCLEEEEESFCMGLKGFFVGLCCWFFGGVGGEVVVFVGGCGCFLVICLVFRLECIFWFVF